MCQKFNMQPLQTTPTFESDQTIHITWRVNIDKETVSTLGVSYRPTSITLNIIIKLTFLL